MVVTTLAVVLEPVAEKKQPIWVLSFISKMLPSSLDSGFMLISDQ